VGKMHGTLLGKDLRFILLHLFFSFTSL